MSSGKSDVITEDGHLFDLKTTTPPPDPAVVEEMRKSLRSLERIKLLLVGLLLLCLSVAFAATFLVSPALLWGSYGICFASALICGFVLRGVSRAYWSLRQWYDKLFCRVAYYEMLGKRDKP